MSETSGSLQRKPRSAARRMQSTAEAPELREGPWAAEMETPSHESPEGQRKEQKEAVSRGRRGVAIGSRKGRAFANGLKSLSATPAEEAPSPYSREGQNRAFSDSRPAASPQNHRAYFLEDPDTLEGFTEGALARDASSEPDLIPFAWENPLRRKLPLPKDDSLEDTSIHLLEPEQKTFFKKQPAWFWLLCALLLISLFTVVLIIGVNAMKEKAAIRAEERRIQELANEKAKYKYLYRDAIERYSLEQGVDPALVAAMIYNESRFDPGAVSVVGARGLMQIMDDTGEWIAGRLDESNGYTFDSLFDPEKNLRYGIWYVGFLARMFEGNLAKMIAGYHAGQNAVTGWLRDPKYSKNGTTLDVIPYPDTEQYVKRVVAAYAIYIKHYYTPEEPAPQASDNPA